MGNLDQPYFKQWQLQLASILACLVLCSLFRLSANAAPSYEIAAKQDGDNEIIRLYDRTSGRTVWTQQVHDHHYVVWSRDHRAICIGVYAGEYAEPSLLVWRENHPQVVVAYGDDYLLDGMAWSPDSNRVLIRTGFSGASDVDMGTLRSLDTRNNEISTLTPEGGVRRMCWASSDEVLYWDASIEDSTITIDTKPGVWSPP